MHDQYISDLLGMKMYQITDNSKGKVNEWFQDLTEHNKRTVKYTEYKGQIYVNEGGKLLYEYYSQL